MFPVKGRVDDGLISPDIHHFDHEIFFVKNMCQKNSFTESIQFHRLFLDFPTPKNSPFNLHEKNGPRASKTPPQVTSNPLFSSTVVGTFLPNSCARVICEPCCGPCNNDPMKDNGDRCGGTGDFLGWRCTYF